MLHLLGQPLPPIQVDLHWYRNRHFRNRCFTSSRFCAAFGPTSKLRHGSTQLSTQIRPLSTPSRTAICSAIFFLSVLLEVRYCIGRFRRRASANDASLIFFVSCSACFPNSVRRTCLCQR